ncbi:OmpW family outer membrane protein [Ferrovibrio sp.]|uniref:OmpW/AlkL family protein n=1 Tax=Ferrovibrio sp. TaxID=1917215 RepID=UPI00261DEB39|nr:OmpW family outer membrane protein [Ferrovibrio sp.]
MRIGKYLAAATGAALLLFGMVPTTAFAQDGKSAGDIMVRGRIIGLLPDEDSTVTVIGGKVDASNAFTAEVDFSYFFTDNIAAELIAATTKHKMQVDGSSSGDVGLGDVWLLPPTLTLQYHFMPKQAFSPYVGAGLTYAVFYNKDVPSTLRSVDYDNAWGYALQAGFDYKIAGNWYFNADVKKIFLNTDVKVVTNAGTVINADVDLDPWVVGVGVGYKF